MPDEEKPSASTIPEAPATALPNHVGLLRTTADMPDGDHRAELQAMLALLAVQLVEVAHTDEDDSGAPVDKEPPAAAVTLPSTVDTVSAVVSTAQQQEEEEDSDKDMEEVM